MIQVFPTRNIHLVSAFPTAQMDLSICMDWPLFSPAPVWTDLINGAHGIPLISPLAPIVANTATPSIGAASPTGISLRASAVGAQFYSVGANVGGTSVFTVVRIATHADIRRLHVPYGDIYMFAGANNFVITVFADFDDNESWDVSEHPYLEFDTADHSIATIDSSGRLTAVATGQTAVTIQPTGRPAMSVQCNVHVDTIASWVTSNKIVVKRGRQPAAASRKLFLVSEGYTDADRFEKHASEIGDRIFSEPNAPFQLVKSQFAVTRVFVRSAGTGGISIGPPLDAPTTGTHWTIDTGAAAVPHGTYDPASLSAFGFVYGQRVGDADGELFLALGGLNGQAGWTGGVATRSISMDLRRVGPYRTLAPLTMVDPRTSFVTALKALFTQLQLSFGPDDRVVFMIDDQMRGGAGFSVAGIDVKPRQFVSLAVGTTYDWFDGVHPQAGSPIALRVPVADTYHADYAASSITHELGHTFRLGDEYEGSGGRPTNTAAVAREQMEEYENVQLTGDLVANYNNPAVDPPAPYDLTRLKWTIPRAAKASFVTAVKSAGANTIVATIAGNAEKIWNEFEQVRIRTSFRTARPRATDGSVDPNVPRLRDFPYEIQGVDGSNVILFSSVGNVSGSTGDDLTDLCVLYKPVGDDIENPVHVMDPLVEAFVTAHGAFPRPPIGCVATTDDGQPPTIPSFTNPKVPADVIGVYQGGDYVSCGVVRPSGRCKLRLAAQTTTTAANILVPTEILQFCKVCKTVIADQIDPSVLPKIK